MAAKSIFLLAGDEEFLKEEWLSKTKQEFFKKKQDCSVDFNLFFANDADLSSVLTAAKTKPFLANKRLIILKNIENLSAASDRERLLSYAKAPSSDSMLILEANIKEKALGQDKFLFELSKLSQPVFFKKLYNIELSTWIGRRFLARKKKAAPQAIEFLKELKGNNLGALDKEIEKLTLYAAERPLVTEEDVRCLVGNEAENSIYDILDAISRSDKKKALGMSLGFGKADLGEIVGLFCWNLRKILRVRECLKQNWPLQKIADALELKKFQLDRFVPQAKRIKTSWLKLALEELAEFDLKIKTSSFGNPVLGWEMLMTKLLASL